MYGWSIGWCLCGIVATLLASVFYLFPAVRVPHCVRGSRRQLVGLVVMKTALQALRRAPLAEPTGGRNGASDVLLRNSDIFVKANHR